MADVPLKTNPLRRSKHPAARVCASASLQPTHTGIPSGSPNRRAAAAETVPRGSQAAAIGGQASAGQPHASSTSAAGAPSVTRQMPFDDQGSDAGLPVSCRPTRSFGCSSHRVRCRVAGSCRASQSSLAGMFAADQGRAVPISGSGSPKRAFSSAASAVARVSCQVSAGRTGLPAASTGTSVGVWPQSPTAVTRRRSAPVRRSALASARDQALGSCSTWPAGEQLRRVGVAAARR
jgi:hypothetical protein